LLVSSAAYTVLEKVDNCILIQSLSSTIGDTCTTCYCSSYCFEVHSWTRSRVCSLHIKPSITNSCCFASNIWDSRTHEEKNRMLFKQRPRLTAWVSFYPISPV